MTETLRIDYMPLSKLVRAPRNCKDHDLGVLHDSFARFGYVAPIILDERTGRLVAGHGRLDTLQQKKAQGKRAPERIRVEGDEWLIPVLRGVEFKDDVESESYLIADNRTTELGGWKHDDLVTMLSDLASKDALLGIGYDKEDIDALLSPPPAIIPSSTDVRDSKVIECPKCGHEWTE